MTTVVNDIQVSMPALELVGAPDLGIGNAQQEQQAPRALQLDLALDTIEEVKKSAQSGKHIQVSFGNAPSLRIGDVIQPLQISPLPFRYEVYQQAAQEKPDLGFAGILSHRAAILEVKNAAEAADSALQTLTKELAEYNQHKLANSATFIGNQSGAIHSRKRANKSSTSAKKSSWNKNPSLFQIQKNSNSLPPSPSLLPDFHRLTGPTSSASQPPRLVSAKFTAQQFVVLHFLALRPASQAQIIKQTGVSKEDLTPVLNKIASPTPADSPTDPPTELWKLNDRSFKTLDVWAFPYSFDTDRQAAIDNAVRAFDYQRVSREDKLWQSLLPKEKRNKGIVLSKLKLGGSSAAQNLPANGSPAPAKENPSSLSDHKKLPAALGGESTARSNPAPQPQKPDMARAKAPAGRNKIPASKSTKSSTARGTVTKKTTKTKQPETTDFGDANEGSSDLEEVLSGLNSGPDKKKVKRQNDATETAKPTAGTKRKSDTKFKSEEYVHDSSELLDDEDDDEDAGKPEKKRLKTEKEASKSKSTQDSSVAKTEKPPVSLPDKSSKISSMSKNQPVSNKPSDGKPRDREQKYINHKPKPTAQKDDTKAKIAPSTTSPPKPKSKEETVQQSKSKAQGSNTVSTLSKTYPPKNAPKHQHSNSHSSSPSNGPTGERSQMKKRPAESHSSPEVAAKKRRPEGKVEKTQTLASSSPLTNASDLPNINTPDGLTPRSNGPLRANAGESDEATASSPTVQRELARVARKPEQKGHDNTKANGVSPTSAETHGESSPNEGLIASLKDEYTRAFKEHVIRHLALDQLPADAPKPGKAEYKAKFAELKDLAATIKTLLKRSGRGGEAFPEIPDDFSSASVPGLIEYAQGKIGRLSERYELEREEYVNGEKDDETKQRLIHVFNEIQELEALRDH